MSTVLLIHFWLLHAPIASIYFLFRDTTLKGERIVPVASRIGARLMVAMTPKGED